MGLPCNEPALGFVESIAVDQGRVGIVVFALREDFEVLELLETCADVLPNESAPEFSLFEYSHVESCDDTEITGATFQGLEQIYVFIGVGIDEQSGGKNNLDGRR